MTNSALQAKAHALISQLDPGRLSVVVQFLESMLRANEEDEEISLEEEASVARSKRWFQENDGIPFDQLVADLGFTMDQIRTKAAEDTAA